MSVDGSPRLAAAPGAPVLFLSAHLDDAVFSCGALIAELAASCPVTVATVFTEAAAPPYTYAARSFLRQCGSPDVGTLYSERRAEDLEVLAGLGAGGRHLGMVDALFRRRRVRPAALARLAGALPELVHRYPTYRFDIALGRVSRGDRALVDELAGRTRALVAELGAAVLIAPVGVGRHVDHLVTRSVGEALGARTVYYSDYPYNLTAGPDPEFLRRHRLTAWDRAEGVPGKDAAIRGYRTQYEAIFGDTGITHRPETYFEAPTPASRAH